MEVVTCDGMEVVARFGQICQENDFWKVLGLARNPSKKMRLDESFRMVRGSCHLEVVVKSYGQNTVTISRNIFAYFWAFWLRFDLKQIKSFAFSLCQVRFDLKYV